MINLGINGFGRIGKCIFLQLIHNTNFQICCLNALDTTIDEIEDYLNYDSTHKYSKDIKVEIISPTEFKINHHIITLLSGREAKNLNWKKYNCEYIIDATGCYLTTEKCKEHDVNYVIISAPPKDNTPTFIYGANHELYKGEQVISNSSCTTNCLAPMLKILHDNYTINNCVFTTIHATTATQYTVDIINKSARTNRSIFNNIIPHSTGASSSITCVLPELEGKINGTSLRVPVLNCSLLDLNVELEDKSITLQDISNLLTNHELFNIVYQINNKNLVSCDFISTKTPTILDIKASIDLGNGRFKLMIWYDNEWSYSAQLIRNIKYMYQYNHREKCVQKEEEEEKEEEENKNSQKCAIEQSLNPKYYFENINMMNKGVVIRCDFNVPTNNGVITDDYRISSAIYTIYKILTIHNPKYIVLTSHFGRPQNKNDKSLSLHFIVPIIEKYLKQSVHFLEDGISSETLETIKKGEHNIYLLENLRFHKEETLYETMSDVEIEQNNVINLYRQLGDVFITDAFGCLHRKHMSICDMQISGKLYGYGKLIQKEVNELNVLITNSNSKILGIIGGNKIKEKMPLIDSISRWYCKTIYKSRISKQRISKQRISKQRKSGFIKYYCYGRWLWKPVVTRETCIY